jgi:transposase
LATGAPLHVRELRGLVDRLQTLKDMQQQELNRLEAHASSPVLSASIHEHVDWLQRCAADLQRQIDDHIDGHPQLRQDAELISSIPGLGQITTPKVLAFLGDVRRFKSAKALAAFIGVTPKLRESGTSVRGRSMLSRAGHTQMRTALYMPARVASRHNPVVKAFGDRLRLAGLAPKAVVGACMHKLALLIYGVLRSGTPFDARIAMPKLDFQDGIWPSLATTTCPRDRFLEGGSGQVLQAGHSAQSARLPRSRGAGLPRRPRQAASTSLSSSVSCSRRTSS